MKEEPIQPDPDETRDETAADEHFADETRDGGDVTRLASEAELADLARLRAKEPQRRKFVFGIVIFLLLGVVMAMVATLLGRNEKSITWPGEVDDTFDDVRQLLRVGAGTALLVYWPNDPQNVVSGDGTNLIDVVTAVGRDRNVPFHLRVTCETLTNGLRVTTRDSYEAWKRAREQDKWALNAADERMVFLNDSESGYPAWSIDYGREGADDVLVGRALYIRHLDREIVVLRELPMAFAGRAKNLFDGYLCVAANLTAVRARFEIPAEREPGQPHELVFTAYKDLQGGFLAADWRRLDRMLRTAILEARERDDQRLLQDATTLYATLREKMQTWYVRACLNFQQLNDPTREDDLEEGARRASRTAIRLECARRLPEEGDCRQYRIANDDWSLP